MKKKMKRFESGGSIDEGVRARAMKFVEGAVEDETGASKGSIKRNEYGDLYDSEMKAAPKATPKGASKPYSPKSQPDSDREENSAFMRQFRKDEAAAKKSSFAAKPSAFAGKTSAFKKMASGGKVSSASSRADGCATKGKTKGRMV
jgi:hypothetical protein